MEKEKGRNIDAEIGNLTESQNAAVHSGHRDILMCLAPDVK